MAGEPTWPDFESFDGTPEVEIIGGETRPFKAADGSIYPVSIAAPVRYRFTFRYGALGTGSDRPAPHPYEAMSEVACVVSLITTLKGSAGLINVVNPLDGATYLCRLASDSLPVKALVAGLYEAEVVFLSQ